MNILTKKIQFTSLSRFGIILLFSTMLFAFMTYLNNSDILFCFYFSFFFPTALFVLCIIRMIILKMFGYWGEEPFNEFLPPPTTGSIVGGVALGLGAAYLDHKNQKEMQSLNEIKALRNEIENLQMPSVGHWEGAVYKINESYLNPYKK